MPFLVNFYEQKPSVSNWSFLLSLIFYLYQIPDCGNIISSAALLIFDIYILYNLLVYCVVVCFLQRYALKYFYLVFLFLLSIACVMNRARNFGKMPFQMQWTSLKIKSESVRITSFWLKCYNFILPFFAYFIINA